MVAIIVVLFKYFTQAGEMANENAEYTYTEYKNGNEKRNVDGGGGKEGKRYKCTKWKII